MTDPGTTERDCTFDSAAELLGTITTRLGAQLSHVRLNGVRRDRPALVAVGHGSRDPRARAALVRLVERVRELRPGLDVELAHIELDAPLLTDVLTTLTPPHTPPAGAPAAGGRRAVLVPLLFGPGYHVKHDLPAAAAAVPGGRVRIAAPLGPHPLLVEALADRLAEAGWTSADSASRSTGVVLAAAGSRDREGLLAVRRIAAALSERLGGVPVVPAYASAATPTVPDAVRTLAARGRHRVAVASCFTAPGFFASRAAAHAPWIASSPLGAHPALARLVLHRYDQALTGPAPTAMNALAPHPVPTWREFASA
ncbi:sirohydrochlorin chelatase [Streptomyces sp. NPDC090127]|uniref:sirohydrochlorin chelatase n=1 Tax=Streptomyces sp. NPDC090127 TaxID=3365953 RepID=UPI0038213BB9